jgi:metal regulatory transcription factor 1
MVKHQRRSHQQGMNPNDIDDCSSDSGDDESPSTPQHSSMTWSPHETASKNRGSPNGHLHRASSYADFESRFNGHHMSQNYGNWQRTPASVPHEYDGTPAPEQHVHVQLVHRTVAMPRQAYYVTEAGNADVATMTSTRPPHYQLSQQVERPPMEPPYTALGTATSIQSSHFFRCVCPKPHDSRGLLRTPVWKPAMIQYHQPIQHHMTKPQQPVFSQPQHIPATTGHYAPTSGQPHQEQWSHYDPPIEATTIGQLPPYRTAVYDI